MKLQSKAKPIYLPEEGQHTILRLGLQGVSADSWILTDDDLPLFLQHKRLMYCERPEKVIATLPGSLAAREELRQLLEAHLTRDHAALYEKQDETLCCPSYSLEWPLSPDQPVCPLREASLWVAEDICLMEEIDGEYLLTAASVCSPTNWYLEDKIGNSIDTIHDPVPGYSEGLDERVRRLFRKLSKDKVLERFNWSVQRGSELFWRDDLGMGNEGPGSALYWRVERQTLRRLPETGAIVFGIRLFLHSFDALASYPDFQRSLGTIAARLPKAMREYKEVPEIKNGP